MKRIIFILVCLLSVNLFPAGKFYKVMEKSFVLIQAADIASTYYLIGKGYVEEGNPLAASYIHKPLVVIGIKAALTAGVLVLCRKTNKKYRTVAIITLMALNTLGSYVIYNNLKVGR